MSELKAYTSVDIDVLYISGELDCTNVYLKSEADAVIAEKDKEIEELTAIKKRLEEANEKVEKLNDELYNEWKFLFKKWCGDCGMEADK